MADFRDNSNLSLRQTDLLTLSACETGISGNSGNGREVDGLGTTAQLKGARSVISSLWEVSDASTGELMADFYRRWSSGSGKVAKVEALRQAQLDLLMGKIKPKPDLASPTHRQASRTHFTGLRLYSWETGDKQRAESPNGDELSGSEKRQLDEQCDDHRALSTRIG